MFLFLLFWLKLFYYLIQQKRLMVLRCAQFIFTLNSFNEVFSLRAILQTWKITFIVVCHSSKGAKHTNAQCLDRKSDLWGIFWRIYLNSLSKTRPDVLLEHFSLHQDLPALIIQTPQSYFVTTTRARCLQTQLIMFSQRTQLPFCKHLCLSENIQDLD